MKIRHSRTSVVLLLSALLLAQTIFCEAHANPKPTSSRWLDMVLKRRAPKHSGCAARPWVYHSWAFFPQLPFGKRAACCGNRCVDVKSDENNCGWCGKQCPFSWRCCNGKCIDPKSNPFHCRACNNRCAAGSSCSHGLCGYTTKNQLVHHHGSPRWRSELRPHHHGENPHS